MSYKPPGPPLLRFHCLGVWRPGEIKINWVPSSFDLPPAARPWVEDAWAAAGSRPGIHLFDGPLCRMESFHAREGCLSLSFSRTSYKSFFGTNLRNAARLKSFGPTAFASAVGVSPALISADGRFLMGRRNGSVAFYPEHVHPFSGALEPTPGLDVFAEIRRELREELNFSADDAGDVRVLGIAEDASIRQPELIAACVSRLSKREIEARLDDAEHTGVWSAVASPEALATAATPGRDGTPFTPVARAALLLWGKHAFGERWFDNTRGTWAIT